MRVATKMIAMTVACSVALTPAVQAAPLSVPGAPGAPAVLGAPAAPGGVAAPASPNPAGPAAAGTIPATDAPPQLDNGSSVHQPDGSVLHGPSDSAPLGGSSYTKPHPGTDGANFFTTDAPLESLKQGEVIKTREISYHAFGAALPVSVTQLLYRTNNSVGEASASVTSVLHPVGKPNGHLVSYHSFYDSLNPEHAPSRTIAGDLSLASAFTSTELTLVTRLLGEGYTIAIPDIEGATANFAAGPEYGMVSLDGIRAVLHTAASGVSPNAKVGLMGYSGGAIATAWAAAMAPSYAADVNPQLVGASMGGLLIDPMKNLQYVDGAVMWGGILPFTLFGLAKSYHVDLTPYLSENGKTIYRSIKDAAITESVATYGSAKWTDLVKPQYRDPRSIPELVDIMNKVNLGMAANPTIPVYLNQGAGGVLEGSGPRQWGPGDGLMLADDASALANKWCAAGAPVVYQRGDWLDHAGGLVQWLANGHPWMRDRFDGKPAPSGCGTYAPGNPFMQWTQVAPVDPSTEVDPPQGSTEAHVDHLKRPAPQLPSIGSSARS